MSENTDPLFDSVPTRAARILRAKAGELENYVKPRLSSPGTSDLDWLIADVALIASILAEFIEWSQEWSGRDVE